MPDLRPTRPIKGVPDSGARSTRSRQEIAPAGRWILAVDEGGVRTVAEQFQLAGLGSLPWEVAVQAAADLTGSRTGELIGLGADAAVPFNLITGFGPEVAAEFVAIGGGDPRINSRVRVGSSIRELEVRDEADFTTEHDMRASPELAEWILRYDFAHTCLTPLVKDEGLLVGLAVIRTSAQGNIETDERKAFAHVAAHARAAVRTQLMLQRQSLVLVSGVLDALGVCAFLCDAAGRVVAMSTLADRQLSDGTRLRLASGRIAAVADTSQAALQAAIGEAVLAGIAPEIAAFRPRPIALFDRHGMDPLLAEATPVPRSHPLGLGVAVLLIIRLPSEDEERIAEAARALFGLTPAEARVSAALALGRTVTGIAGEQRVSVGTVRTHVKRIFDKAGVTSQVELVSLLGGLG
ncbi:helix-turn-helix transcriptional regulator [Sphingosinicella sp. CPCC 101087]|uniref:helix-turn-helix transcriptional regulator n=1 Tax=Sphingosinicella sp. CPCC 101087 TaxID=2497754 RepID=UPI00101B7716|nr:helix-turn-helix transcriptional regulator [Sphingosinicella sp. CPCC 101087]